MQIRQEIYRKLFHICLSIIPFLYINIGRTNFIYSFTILTILIVVIDYLRCKSNAINEIITPIFKIIMREKELSKKQLSGLSWSFIGIIINFSIFHPMFAITGLFILTFSDSIAAIVGKSVNSAKFYQKSRAGSLAFFLSSIIVIVLCGIYFDCRLSFFLFSILVAIFVTYLEANTSLFKTDDNLLIPLSYSVCMTILDFMWHIL